MWWGWFEMVEMRGQMGQSETKWGGSWLLISSNTGHDGKPFPCL